MKSSHSIGKKPVSKFDKIFTTYLIFVVALFFIMVFSGFLAAIAVAMMLSSFFGIWSVYHKKNAPVDKRQGTFILSVLLFIVGFTIHPSEEVSMAASFFGVLGLLSLIGLIISVIKPSLFGMFDKNSKSKKLKLSTIFGAVFLFSIIGSGMVAGPQEANLKTVNISDKQEVLTEKFRVEGDFSGTPKLITVNGQSAELENGTYRKDIDLKAGDNTIQIVLQKHDGSSEEKTASVYYDYEGSLYAQLQKKEQLEATDLKKKLEIVPAYEIVRKENMDGGFSAVVYIDESPEDYLVSNTIKHIKYYHPNHQAISLLVFQKSDKPTVESTLDSTDIGRLSSMVRANYEKRQDREELFLFPEGLDGTKLALEV